MHCTFNKIINPVSKTCFHKEKGKKKKENEKEKEGEREKKREKVREEKTETSRKAGREAGRENEEKKGRNFANTNHQRGLFGVTRESSLMPILISCRKVRH